MKTRTDELERLQQAFNTVSETDLPRIDCPPAEQIWDGASGDIDSSAFRETIQHVATCPVCTEAWRLAVALEGEGSASAEDREFQVESSSESFWIRGLGVAASLILALGLGLQLSEKRDDRSSYEETPVARVRSDPGTRSGTLDDEAIVFERHESLPRSHCLLQWDGPVSVAYYRLSVVMMAAGWEGRLDEYLIAPAVFAQAPAGVELEVEIEAFDAKAGSLGAVVASFAVLDAGAP